MKSEEEKKQRDTERRIQKAERMLARALGWKVRPHDWSEKWEGAIGYELINPEGHVLVGQPSTLGGSKKRTWRMAPWYCTDPGLAHATLETVCQARGWWWVLIQNACTIHGGRGKWAVQKGAPSTQEAIVLALTAALEKET